jgi:translation initiation factor 3 subunit E
MTEYDLSKTIIPFLDRHLVFPLLIHLSQTGIFPAEEIQSAQYELVKGTNMYDYEDSLYSQIHPDQKQTEGAM